jgi:hypothetical protein
MKLKLAYKHAVGIITRNNIPPAPALFILMESETASLSTYTGNSPGYKSRMVDERYEAFGGIRMDRGNLSAKRTPAPKATVHHKSQIN